MPADSGSLLTKTQRRRIDDGFEDLDDDAKSRDERRIRERFAVGLQDLSRLVDYPDDQLKLAVEDLEDETLVTALADGRVLLDRVAEVRELDRERIVTRADTRAAAAAESPTSTASLARLNFETETERHERFAREHDDTSIWNRRANRLLQLAAWLFLPAVLLWIPDVVLGAETLSGSLSFGLCPPWLGYFLRSPDFPLNYYEVSSMVSNLLLHGSSANRTAWP